MKNKTEVENYELLLREYENLKKEFEEYKLESIKWSVEDFTDYEIDVDANDEPILMDITPENAKRALHHMIRMKDSSDGVTWSHVEYFGELYSKGGEYEEI